MGNKVEATFGPAEFECRMGGCTLNAQWVLISAGTRVRRHVDGGTLHSWEREELPVKAKWWEFWK